jgi:hypothetical protein
VSIPATYFRTLYFGGLGALAGAVLAVCAGSVVIGYRVSLFLESWLALAVFPLLPSGKRCCVVSCRGSSARGNVVDYLIKVASHAHCPVENEV